MSTFNVGDRVWQTGHAPEGYRFEIVELLDDGLVVGRPVARYDVVRDDGGAIVSGVVVPLDEPGAVVTLNPDRLALSED